MADLQIVRAYKNVEAQYVEMMVPLYSYGCEKKIKKALSHLRGIYSVSVDFKVQKVTVWGICNKYDVLSTLRSKRKGARFWDSEEEAHHEDHQKYNLLDEKQQQPSINDDHHQPIVLVVSTKPFISRLGRSLSWKALKKVISIKSY